MAKETYRKQCKLVKPTENGKVTLVTWVPEKLAVVGQRVTVEDEPDIWTVESVGESRQSDSALKERERIHRKYRRITDV
jgi:hypothetical protein